MFEQLQSYYDTFTAWAPWLGLGGAGVFAVLWFFGLTAILGGVLQVFAALLNIFSSIIAPAIGWFWSNILWPGLKNIFENFASIVVMLICFALLFLYIRAQDAIHYRQLAYRDTLQIKEYDRALAVCNVELIKANKKAPKVIAETIPKTVKPKIIYKRTSPSSTSPSSTSNNWGLFNGR